MKSERITFLGSPAFKVFVNAEAKRERTSVAELIRARCRRCA